MRRSRHCLARIASSASAMLSQLPCLARAMPLEALRQALRLLRFKGFVERGGRVGVQIILNQGDLFCFCKMHIAQVFENTGVIFCCALVFLTSTQRQPSSGANSMNRLSRRPAYIRNRSGQAVPASWGWGFWFRRSAVLRSHRGRPRGGCRHGDGCKPPRCLPSWRRSLRWPWAE